jgi:hypothetical protein
LRPNSLEDLVPDYKLEGMRVVLTPGPLTATVALARTAMPIETKTFSQYVIAGRTTWAIPGLWRGTQGTLAATVMRATDDAKSVVGAQKQPLRSDVVGVDADVPLVGSLALTGEFAYSLRDDNLRLPDPLGKDYGLLAGVRLGDRTKRDFQLTYIQTNPNFNPLYRALSYARDRRGVRASLALRQMGPRLVRVQLFGKYLREIKAMDGSEFTDGRFTGSYVDVAGSFRCDPLRDLTVGVEGEWRTNKRQDDELTQGFDEKLGLNEVLASALAIVKLVDACNVMVKYTLTVHREVENAYHGANNYISHTPSVEVAVKF